MIYNVPYFSLKNERVLAIYALQSDKWKTWKTSSILIYQITHTIHSSYYQNIFLTQKFTSFILIKTNRAHNRIQKDDLLLHQYFNLGLHLLCYQIQVVMLPLIWFISWKNMLYPGRIYAYKTDKSSRTITLSRLMLYNCLLFCRLHMSSWWKILTELCQYPSYLKMLRADKFIHVYMYILKKNWEYFYA